MIKKEFKKFYAEFNNIDDIEKASEEVEVFLETMKAALSSSSKVVFRNFGTFEVRETKERKVLDPRGNNEVIHTKPRKYVKFIQSINLENKL